MAQVTEDTWPGDENPEPQEVELRDPDGNVTRWRVEPEATVTWHAAEATRPFDLDRCVCGCVATAHVSKRGACRVCAKWAHGDPPATCETFRRAPEPTPGPAP